MARRSSEPFCGCNKYYIFRTRISLNRSKILFRELPRSRNEYFVSSSLFISTSASPFARPNNSPMCHFTRTVLSRLAFGLIFKTIITFSSSLIRTAIKITRTSRVNFHEGWNIKKKRGRARWSERGIPRDRDHFRGCLISKGEFPGPRWSLRRRMGKRSSGSSYELLNARTSSASNQIKMQDCPREIPLRAFAIRIPPVYCLFHRRDTVKENLPSHG